MGAPQSSRRGSAATLIAASPTEAREGLHGAAAGFILTKGYLHAGHASLIRRSAADGLRPCVCVLLAHHQFGPGENYALYPRDAQRDRAVAEEAGAAVLWQAQEQEMQPQRMAVEVAMPHFEQQMSAFLRPETIRGYATQMARLLGMFRPERVYFGEIDWHWAVVTRQLMAALSLPGEAEICPTVREPDGLAVSARNVRLTPEDRRHAPEVAQSLFAAQRLFADSGESESSRLVGRTSAMLTRIPGFRLQYLRLLDPDDLMERSQARPGDILLMAGYFGATRLIDCVRL